MTVSENLKKKRKIKSVVKDDKGRLDIDKTLKEKSKLWYRTTTLGKLGKHTQEGGSNCSKKPHFALSKRYWIIAVVLDWVCNPCLDVEYLNLQGEVSTKESISACSSA